MMERKDDVAAVLERSGMSKSQARVVVFEVVFLVVFEVVCHFVPCRVS